MRHFAPKGYVQQNESSDFVVTAAGADQVETNLSSHEVFRTLLRASEEGRSV